MCCGVSEYGLLSGEGGRVWFFLSRPPGFTAVLSMGFLREVSGVWSSSCNPETLGFSGPWCGVKGVVFIGCQGAVLLQSPGFTVFGVWCSVFSGVVVGGYRLLGVPRSL